MNKQNEIDYKREKQNDWLEFILRTLPRDAKKTVFMHTPLYIENITEIHAADKGKSLRQEHSLVHKNLSYMNYII